MGRSAVFKAIPRPGWASWASMVSRAVSRPSTRSTEARHSAMEPALCTGQERAEAMCWKAWADCMSVPRVIRPRM